MEDVSKEMAGFINLLFQLNQEIVQFDFTNNDLNSFILFLNK